MAILIIAAVGVMAAVVVGVATGNVEYEQVRITFEMVIAAVLGSGTTAVVLNKVASK